MTIDEYKELHERTKKYESYNQILQQLIQFRDNCKSGIVLIRPIKGTTQTDVYCNDVGFGNGFQELATKKILEAFHEQIECVKKQLEEL